MDYSLNLKAFLMKLPRSKMNGAEKFLAVSALIAGGTARTQVLARDVQDRWRRSILQGTYSPSFYSRAQNEGWIDPSPNPGVFVITQPGLDHLSSLSIQNDADSHGEMRRAGGLVVVNRKGTHTFDKYLRTIFVGAKTEVCVADAWVDQTTFDNALDLVPKSIPFRLIYAEARGTFDQRATRFGTEFSKFRFRRYKPLHDRFMVVDEKGYVLGPSIKDAATQSPAIVIEVGPKEKRLLRSFFDELWEAAKVTTI